MVAPRFTVITPCFNAASMIVPTLESILSQSAVRSGRVQLQYIVCDGGSTDGTQELVRKVGAAAQLISEPDTGMYHALAKGLRLATGDIVSYLNAGDLYFPSAFDVVADIIDGERVSWLTGVNVAFNHRHQAIETVLPHRYRRDFIRKGIYGRIIRCIQQESTFWSRKLLESVDLKKLAGYQLAGDFYLWSCFAQSTDLHIVDSLLGGFTYHPGQRSENYAAYLQELNAIRIPYGMRDWILARIDERLWDLPAQWKKRLNPRFLLRYNRARAAWE